MKQLHTPWGLIIVIRNVIVVTLKCCHWWYPEHVQPGLAVVEAATVCRKMAMIAPRKDVIEGNLLGKFRQTLIYRMFALLESQGQTSLHLFHHGALLVYRCKYLQD